MGKIWDNITKRLGDPNPHTQSLFDGHRTGFFAGIETIWTDQFLPREDAPMPAAPAAEKPRKQAILKYKIGGMDFELDWSEKGVWYPKLTYPHTNEAYRIADLLVKTFREEGKRYEFQNPRTDDKTMSWRFDLTPHDGKNETPQMMVRIGDFDRILSLLQARIVGEADMKAIMDGTKTVDMREALGR